MASKIRRVLCPSCKREVGWHPTRGIGIVSVADHKPQRHALVLCPGSMQHVQAADARYVQESLRVPEQREEPVPLF